MQAGKACCPPFFLSSFSRRSHVHKTFLTPTSVMLSASPPLRTTTMVLLLPLLSRDGERAISTSFLLLLLLLVLPFASASMSRETVEGPVKAVLCVV